MGVEVMESPGLAAPLWGRSGSDLSTGACMSTTGPSSE